MKKLIFTLTFCLGMFTYNANAQCGVQCAAAIPIPCDPLLPSPPIVAGGCVYACLVPTEFTCVLTPVELSEFKGQTTENEVALSWTTESEDNNEYFVVSRSFDGVNFKVIGQVKGSGTTSERNTYTFEDNSVFTNASSNNAYYKLEQADSDAFTLTQAGMLNVELSPEKVLNIQNVIGATTDNPVIVFTAPSNDKYSLNVMDMNGRTLLSTQISAEQGFNQAELTTSGLSKGIYLISISNGRQNVTHKIVR